MKIQIDGTNSLNKGAELMLMSVLEQIEKYHPNATVYYNAKGPLEPYIKQSSVLDIRQRFALKYSKFPIALLSRLKIPFVYFTEKHPIDNLDLVLDASGFQFSDQWNYSDERLDNLENYYKILKRNGTKIILLPQALGPFRTKAGKRVVSIVDKYVDLTIAREEISRKYLVDAGASPDRVGQCTDFTLLTKGVFPEQFASVKGKICIVPNKKMITHTDNEATLYWSFLENLIIEIEKKGHELFFLNHEGPGDLAMCHTINNRFNNKFEVVSGLNARETKGVIGSAFATISSRFHGVASSLNQEVPCLATSWNHKYEMLFKDFQLKDKILYLDVKEGVNEQKVSELIDQNSKIRQLLSERKDVLIKEVEDMWQKVWEII